MIPQLIWIALAFWGLLLHAHKHGKPKTGRHNFVYPFLATIIVVLLLYYGGFFNPLLHR